MTTLRLLPDFEAALRHLPGVRAVSVVTGADARPTEVHVLADRNKPAKQVVRDIQSLAMARYDLDIDHRIVSVVQIDDELGRRAEEPDAAAGRPPLASVDPIGTAEQEQAAPATAAERPAAASMPTAEPASRPLVEKVGVVTTGTEAEVSVTLRLGSDAF